MARRKSETLTVVELEFMQVVWPAGEATTETVMAALAAKGRMLSDGTVRKMLSILIRKGYATRRRHGRGFIYKAVVPQDKAMKSMVMDIRKRVFGGSSSQMVATLIDDESITREELDKIKKLVAKRTRRDS